MMNLRYINSENEVLNLYEYPYMLDDQPIFDYSWNYSVNETGNNQSQLKRFYSNGKEIPCKLTMHADTELEFRESLRHFTDVVEKDVINEKPGRLVLPSGEYINCYVINSENDHWNEDIRANIKTITFLFLSPFWVTEATKEFYPIQREDIEADFLDYPYDFDYDYAHETPGIRTWKLDHYSTSEFKMTIYGYCENPRILINGYPYQIFGTVEENEYLVIDSRAKTVTHYLNNGTTENWFDFRNKENSVFEPLPSGNLTVTWDGTYGFDILAYLERSEPKWT